MPKYVCADIEPVNAGFKPFALSIRQRLGGSFFIRIHVPPHVQSGLQIFCETKFKTGGKKHSKFFFPAKMGSNSGEPSTRTAHALPCLHTQKPSVYQLVHVLHVVVPFIAISMLQNC